MIQPEVYNKKERPFAREGKPVVVDVDIYVTSISDVSEMRMDYSISMFLRQSWTDPRLNFENVANGTEFVILSYQITESLWLPDLYVKNAKTNGELHDMTVPNILFRVWPNGTILYSQRISLSVSCPMQLQKYPLDTQHCKVYLESYGYPIEDEIFNWHSLDPIEISDALELPDFRVSAAGAESCTTNYTNGVYSCIVASFTFNRLFEYYLIRIYIPSVFIVILSWVSFWIDLHSVPARISLGLLTILTIATENNSLNAHMPRVSYIKAMDVWMFTNTVFIFLALLEFSVVNILSRSHKAKLERIKRVQEVQICQNCQNETINGKDLPGLEQKQKKMSEKTSSDCETNLDQAMDIYYRFPKNREPPNISSCEMQDEISGKFNRIGSFSEEHRSMQNTTTVERFRTAPTPENKNSSVKLNVLHSSASYRLDKHLRKNIECNSYLKSNIKCDQYLGRGIEKDQYFHNDFKEDKNMTWVTKLVFKKALLVDVTSRLLFPVSYIAFNILYWLHYCSEIEIYY